MTDAGDPSAVPLRALPAERYREFSRLGAGSMGVVYLALDTEMNRRVAFKMVRPADASVGPLEATPTPQDESGELQARFLQEAWVTGGLEHPGIVPVYELGQTPQGVPYYTMRLVRGRRTLADAIEEAGDLEARLALLEPFLRICDTVRYAHARGVIHRDLKPANIALGEYGETVVLDWGLAKLENRPDHARAVWQERIEVLRTETDLETIASAIGTPGYMSPEAAFALLDEVDRRSDVYSLGAILYRILTGELPHEFRTYGELMERLAAGPPRSPSELDPAIPAALSRICLRALAADRADRYGDADELALAIRSWQRESEIEREVASLHREADAALGAAPDLGGDALLRQVDRVTAICARVLELRPGDDEAEALQARGRELRETAIAQRERGARRKLLRRVAVVSLLAATAVTVVVALLLDARRREAEEARARETEARARAEQERNRAEELSRFMLMDLSEGLEPIGRLDLLGDVARKTRDYYESLPAEEVSSEELRRRGIAISKVADVLKETGELQEAEESYRRARAIAERLAEENPDRENLKHGVAVSLQKLGEVLKRSGDLEGALGCYRELLDVARGLAERSPDNPQWQRDVRFALDNVGEVLMQRGDLEGARKVFSEALDLRRILTEQDPTSTAAQKELSNSLECLGVLSRRAEEFEQAAEHHRAALEIRRRLVEQDPANAGWVVDLANCLCNLGDALEEANKLQGALESQSEALEIRRSLAGRDPSNVSWQGSVASSLRSVGALQQEMDELEAALESYRGALAIDRRLVRVDTANKVRLRQLAMSLNRYGRLLHAKGEAKKALEMFREALGIARRLAEQDPSNLAWQHGLSVALLLVGEALESQGECQQSLPFFREALEAHGRALELAPYLAERHALMTRRCRKAELLAGEREPETPADHLEYGYLQTSRGAHLAAARSFAQALTEEALRDDLSRGNLFHGACAAARASAELDGDGATSWRKRALDWLRDDVARHRKVVALVDKALRGSWGQERGVHLRRLKETSVSHLEHVRSGAPDLEVLRGAPEFEKLFEPSD